MLKSYYNASNDGNHTSVEIDMGRAYLLTLMILTSSRALSTTEITLDATAHPWSNMKSPIIMVLTGMKSHYGKDNQPGICKIYLKDFPKKRKQPMQGVNTNDVISRSELLKLIRAVGEAKDTTALHFKATVPSVDIYTYWPSNKNTRFYSILLESDYQKMVYKEGKEAAKIRTLAKAFCNHQNNTTKKL